MSIVSTAQGKPQMNSALQKHVQRSGDCLHEQGNMQAMPWPALSNMRGNDGAGLKICQNIIVYERPWVGAVGQGCCNVLGLTPPVNAHCEPLRKPKSSNSNGRSLSRCHSPAAETAAGKGAKRLTVTRAPATHHQQASAAKWPGRSKADDSSCSYQLWPRTSSRLYPVIV